MVYNLQHKHEHLKQQNPTALSPHISHQNFPAGFSTLQPTNEGFQTLTIISMASMSGKKSFHGIVTSWVWYTVST